MEKKTSTIGIPQRVASHTLKSLAENNFTCQYEGVDQAGRILMKLNYLSDQDGYLQKLIAEMEEGEQSITLLLEIGGLMLINEIAKARDNSVSTKLKKRDGSK